jgi:protoporphyrinogen oxidase
VETRTEILVLGAGMTGLSVALRLKERHGARAVVIERDTRPGGLMKTWREGPIAIDVLPHVVFTRDASAATVLRRFAGPIHEHRHRLGVLWQDGWVDYPFQNHVHQLAPRDRRRVLAGLLEARVAGAGEPRDLEEYARRVLGAGITDLFFRPYNEKLLQTPLPELGWRWLDAKIRLPGPEELADSILGTEPAAPAEVAPHREFWYPRRGGIETIVEGMVAAVGGGAIRCAEEVVRIDLARRHVVTTRATVGYDRLVSTLPLDRTFRLAGLRAGRATASRLRATRVTTVHLALRASRLPDFHWIYVPDPALPFYRLTRVDRIAPDAVPGAQVLLVECAQHRDDPTDPAATADLVVRELERLGLASATDVLRRWAFATAPAYPIPHRDHHRDVPRLLEILRSSGVVSAGRFGEWQQHNMDHCLLSGFDAADEVTGS